MHVGGALTLVALGMSVWWTRCEADVAHAEMRALRSLIQAGMTPQEVEPAFETLQPQRLRFLGATASVILVVQQQPESGFKDWVLWVSLRQGTAAAVRIRTGDSADERPPDAPEDILWQSEDRDTPFH